MVGALNYHEMTMNEPRDSPARRQQFLVICTVMASCFLYAFVSAGGFHPVTVSTDESSSYFPGGTFVYKSTKRDYAASLSLAEHIADDAKFNSFKNEYIDQIYMLYLDHPYIVSTGRQQRFACGYLSRKNDNDEDDDDIKSSLLQMNDAIIGPTRKEVDELPAFQLWKRLKYKQQILPKTKALVVNFPFSNGFVSALMFSYRILPALHKQAKIYYNEKNKKKNNNNKQQQQQPPPIVVISTCSAKDAICTHYVPVVGDDEDNDAIAPFLLGQPGMEEYVTTLPIEPMIDVSGIGRTFLRVFGKMTNIFATKSPLNANDNDDDKPLSDGEL